MRWWECWSFLFFFLKKARDLITAKASLNWCGLINIISDHKTTQAGYAGKEKHLTVWLLDYIISGTGHCGLPEEPSVRDWWLVLNFITYNENSHRSFFGICIVLISQCKFTHAVFSLVFIVTSVSHNNSFTNSIFQLKIHVGGVNVIRKNGSWRYVVLMGAPMCTLRQSPELFVLNIPSVN